MRSRRRGLSGHNFEVFGIVIAVAGAAAVAAAEQRAERVGKGGALNCCPPRCCLRGGALHGGSLSGSRLAAAQADPLCDSLTVIIVFTGLVGGTGLLTPEGSVRF